MSQGGAGGGSEKRLRLGKANPRKELHWADRVQHLHGMWISAWWVTLSLPLQEHKAKVTELEQQVAQAKTRYSVALRNLEQISEQIHARRRGLSPHPPGQRRSSPIGAEAGPDGGEDGDSGIIEGADGGGLEEALTLEPGTTQDTDTLSLLSLRTVASDLQKCDSVEHLRGLSDHTSLDGQEMDPQSGGHRGSYSGNRGGRHQRSVSL